MESHIEKLLTVFMNKIEEGIPDGKGGYLERPIKSDAERFVADCGGEYDAAVAAAAHDIFIRKPHWSASVWKNALLVVVGTLPFVGSTAVVFCSQFESLWRQLRFVALAATIHGHDVSDDATQCQIVLCLLDDKIRKRDGASAMDKIYSKGVKSGIQVAATIIARQVIAKGGTGFFVKRVLGGLLAGVVPEAVSALYTAFWTGGLSNEAEIAIKTKALLGRVKEHFKKEEQPSYTVAIVAFLVWFIPVLIKNAVRIGLVFDKLLLRIQHFAPIQHVPGMLLYPFSFADTILAMIEPILPFAVRDTLVALVLLKFKLFLAFLTFWALLRISLAIARSHTWVISMTALGIRAFLNFVSARNTAVSIGLSVLAMSNWENVAVYHAHRAAVGLFMISCRYRKDFKPLIPYMVASLLVWILYYVVLCVYASVATFVPLLLSGNNSGAYLSLLTRTDLVSKGRLQDAIDAVCTIALHVLLEEIRRPDIIMSLVGPKKVVEGILYAAKSLGNVVASPDSALFWLDKATPPFTISWALLSGQYSATGLGLVCGVCAELQLLNYRELSLLCYCVLISVPFFFWQRELPPPHEHMVWADALKSRHRLLYLIPELDDGFRDRLYYAIDFFGRYEFAKARSQEYASSQLGKVKGWFRRRQESEESEEMCTEVAGDHHPGWVTQLYQYSWFQSSEADVVGFPKADQLSPDLTVQIVKSVSWRHWATRGYWPDPEMQIEDIPTVEPVVAPRVVEGSFDEKNETFVESSPLDENVVATLETRQSWSGWLSWRSSPGTETLTNEQVCESNDLVQDEEQDTNSNAVELNVTNEKPDSKTNVRNETRNTLPGEEVEPEGGCTSAEVTEVPEDQSRSWLGRWWQTPPSKSTEDVSTVEQLDQAVAEPNVDPPEAENNQNNVTGEEHVDDVKQVEVVPTAQDDQGQTNEVPRGVPDMNAQAKYTRMSSTAHPEPATTEGREGNICASNSEYEGTESTGNCAIEEAPTSEPKEEPSSTETNEEPEGVQSPRRRSGWFWQRNEEDRTDNGSEIPNESGWFWNKKRPEGEESTSGESSQDSKDGETSQGWFWQRNQEENCFDVGAAKPCTDDENNNVNKSGWFWQRRQEGVSDDGSVELEQDHTQSTSPQSSESTVENAEMKEEEREDPSSCEQSYDSTAEHAEMEEEQCESASNKEDKGVDTKAALSDGPETGQNNATSGNNDCVEQKRSGWFWQRNQESNLAGSDDHERGQLHVENGSTEQEQRGWFWQRKTESNGELANQVEDAPEQESRGWFWQRGQGANSVELAAPDTIVSGGSCEKKTQTLSEEESASTPEDAASSNENTMPSEQGRWFWQRNQETNSNENTIQDNTVVQQPGWFWQKRKQRDESCNSSESIEPGSDLEPQQGDKRAKEESCEEAYLDDDTCFPSNVCREIETGPTENVAIL